MTGEDPQELIVRVGIVDKARFNPLNVAHSVTQALEFMVIRHRTALNKRERPLPVRFATRDVMESIRDCSGLSYPRRAR